MTTLALLGAGKMGEALLAGLLRAGWSPEDLTFTEKDATRAAALTDTYGVAAVRPEQAAGTADVLVVAVKPGDVATLLPQLGGLGKRTLVVSLCAGLPAATFEAGLPVGTPVVRVMPNTPMLVGEAMSAVSAGTHATAEHVAVVSDLLTSVGRVVVVPEAQQDAVTALSGSGPAYFYLVVEAMVDAGVLLGLSRTVAAELVTQTALGAARMLQSSEAGPSALREAVTSPAGTTAAGTRELEVHGLRTAVFAAVQAARDRSVELGRAQQG